MQAFKKANGRSMPLPKQPQNVTFDLTTLKRRVCKECGGDEFIPAFKMFEVPQLMRHATNGQDTLQVQMWGCVSCGHRQPLNEMVMIGSLKEEEKLSETDTA